MTGETWPTGPDEALFTPSGGAFVPGELARGPWTPDALHGGPVAALVTRAAEQCAADAAMHLARLTVELVRPVPVAPLVVEAALVRPGRKVQIVEVTVRAGDDAVVRARAVRIRTYDRAAPEVDGLPEPATVDRTATGEAPPPPETGHNSPAIVSGYRAFHNTGAELRFVGGEFDRRGPSTVWIRLAAPVVPGETPSPAERAAAAADFGNGVSSVVDYDRFVFINPDLTLYLDRAPEGEWVCLQAVTTLGAPGVGLAQSRLWDHRGPVGRSLQSLVVERRR
ncbi:MAG TPA: thioesterase family protein [Acidimicrobiales bacterium]|nr:thioesterase family protein [Acidimicrobiales bacterium]